jgi:hypothetical protein
MCRRDVSLRLGTSSRKTVILAPFKGKRSASHFGAGAEAKRTIKYLAVCRNPSTAHQVLKHSPDAVVKGVCNVALNAVSGDVRFTPAQRKLFSKHRAAIYRLSDKKLSLTRKRQVLHQRGSGFFIPALIGGVLSLLGSSIVSKIGGK